MDRETWASLPEPCGEERKSAASRPARRPPGGTRDLWDARTEAARRAALDGAVDGPLHEFAQAARSGRGRAEVLRFQLLAMLGDRHTVPLPRLLTREIDGRTVLEHPTLAAEFLPLLFAEERPDRQLRDGYSPLQHLERQGPPSVRELLAAHAARRDTPGHRISYGNPEFDAAVHELAAHLAAETGSHRPGDVPYDRSRRAQEERHRLYERAWPQLHRALTLWRPRDEHHLAPVVLLADPVLAPLITPERGREFLSMARR